jgi:hypothetical protein
MDDSYGIRDEWPLLLGLFIVCALIAVPFSLAVNRKVERRDERHATNERIAMQHARCPRAGVPVGVVSFTDATPNEPGQVALVACNNGAKTFVRLP